MEKTSWKPSKKWENNFELNKNKSISEVVGFSENGARGEISADSRKERTAEVSIWQVLCLLQERAAGVTGRWMGNPSPCHFWLICFLGCHCPRGMEELITRSSGMGATDWWSSVLPESSGARWRFCVGFPSMDLCPGGILTFWAEPRNSPSAPGQFYQKVAVLGQTHMVSSYNQHKWAPAVCRQVAEQTLAFHWTVRKGSQE